MRAGIDIGSAFASIGRVNPQGVPVLLPDLADPRHFRTPCLVHIGEEGALVGTPAETLLDHDPGAPVARFVRDRLGETGGVFKDHRGQDWSAEAVTALILRKLQRDAETAADERVEGVAVVVASHAGDATRRAAKNAAVLAGFPDAALVDEALAVAAFHGASDRRHEKTVLVYDFGAGAFSATVLQAAPDGLFALASEGSADAGGRRIDERLFDQTASIFNRVHRIDVTTDPAARLKLARFLEEAKTALSTPGQGQVHRTLLLANKTHEFLMTRSQFDRLATPVVERTIETCRRALEAASLTWSGVDSILLAGGSAQLPVVARRLAQESGKGADQIVARQPHLAAAYGAALLASQGSGSRPADALRVQRAASHDLGIRVWNKETGAAELKALIKRNTPLPAKHTTTLYTTRADQARMIIDVAQARGGGEIASLGTFAFAPIAKPEKNYPIEVTFAYDAEGLVKITARDPRAGREMEHVIEDREQAAAARLARERDLVMGVAVNP